jgi:hypothetical protein
VTVVVSSRDRPERLAAALAALRGALRPDDRALPRARAGWPRRRAVLTRSATLR